MMKRIIGLLLACICLVAATAGAAPKEFGHTVPEDFSYKGLALGDTKEKLRQVLGEELFDTDKEVFGTQVKFYTYKKYVVGIEAATGRVADIVIKDEDFRLREDVCRGATAYKLFMTYGKNERRSLEGRTYYVYENQQHTRQRLLLELDADDSGRYSLERVRLTSLPLTEEEAGRRKAGESWQENSMDDLQLQSKDIDMSALGDNGPKQREERRQGTPGKAIINYHFGASKGV